MMLLTHNSSLIRLPLGNSTGDLYGLPESQGLTIDSTFLEPVIYASLKEAFKLPHTALILVLLTLFAYIFGVKVCGQQNVICKKIRSRRTIQSEQPGSHISSHVISHLDDVDYV